MADQLPMGAHVEQDDPLTASLERDAQVAQFFLGNPQGFKGPEFRYASGPEALKADAAAAGLGLYVHAPYLVNVATTNNRVRIPSRKLLQQTVNGAAAIGARGVIVHGGHLGADDDPAIGFDNWRKCVEGLDLPVPIFIENTAGGTNAMARHLDRIAQLWQAVMSAGRNTDAVGFCLDTCHAHAGGLAMDTLVADIRAITGRIDLVHANGSRDAADSGADRHANLADSLLDPAAVVAVVHEAAAPTIIETPGPLEAHRADLARLRG